MTHEAIPESWRAALQPALTTAEARRLGGWLRAEEDAGKTIYPPRGDRLRALELTPLDDVKVVILGQDPYHGPGQAHGLSFSVPDGQKLPPSLRNIYKELASDLGVDPPATGDLTHWARQGVLLLNNSLTVEAGQAGKPCEARVGRDHRCGSGRRGRARGPQRLHPVGQPCAGQGGAHPGIVARTDRHESPSGARKRPSQPAFRPPRLLRQQAVQPGECVSGSAWEGRDRLVRVIYRTRQNPVRRRSPRMTPVPRRSTAESITCALAVRRNGSPICMV